MIIPYFLSDTIFLDNPTILYSHYICGYIPMIPIVYVYIPINTGGTVCPGSGSPRSPTHGHGSMGGVRVSWYPLPPCQRSINILGTRWKEHEHPHPAPPHVSVASTSCARSRERGRWNVNIPTPPRPMWAWGRRNTFVSFSEDELLVFFLGRVALVFCKSHCQGCIKWWQPANCAAGAAFCEMCWRLTEASHETSILRW